jgi:hypothetical protein
MRVRRVIIPVVAAALIGACSAQAEPSVLSVADDFHAALVRGDGATACALLAPSTREEVEKSEEGSCPDVVLGLDLPQAGEALGSEVFGDQAQVRFSDDAVFLADFPQGWMVTAAGCRPQGEQLPYDCTVKGA